MNLLNDNEMFSVMQTAMKEYKKEKTPIWHTIIREILSVLIKRGTGVESDDIYDSIFATYGYYNEYVEINNLPFPIIRKEAYDFTTEIMDQTIDYITGGNFVCQE